MRFLLILSLFYSMAASADSFTIFTTEFVTEYLTPELESDVTEMYRRNGITPEWIFLPLVRATHLSIQGDIDAELARVAEYGDDKPELIRVPTPIARVDLYLVMNAETARIKGQDTQQMSMVNLHGLAISETIEHRFKPLSSYSVEFVEQVIRMVVNGRAGFTVLPEETIDLYLNRPEYRGRTVVQPIPEFSYELYHWIHRSHAELLQQLNQTIIQMQSEGYFPGHSPEH